MEPANALFLARGLMTDHGLIADGWKFDFNKSTTAYGYCDDREKKIVLSLPLLQLNTEATITNTILHEIAHALVGTHHGHDEMWKFTALSIGCNGERCTEGISVPRKYTASCPSCGKTAQRDKMRAGCYCPVCMEDVVWTKN